MKLRLLLCLLIGFSAIQSAAFTNVDSLYQLVERAKSSKSKQTAYKALFTAAKDYQDTLLGKYAHQAIDYARSNKLTELEAVAHHFLAIHLRRSGKADEALQTYHTAESLYGDDSRSEDRLLTLFNLASLYGDMGALDQEEQYLEKLEQIAEQYDTDLARGLGAYLRCNRNARLQEGNPSKCDDAIRYLRAADKHKMLNNLLVSYGRSLIGSDDAKAIQLLREAEQVARSADDPTGVAYAYYMQFNALYHVGNYQEAQRAAFKLLKVAEQLQSNKYIIDANLSIGQAHLAVDNMEEAAKYVDPALELARESGLEESLWRANGIKGNVEFGRENYREAADYYQRSKAWSREKGDLYYVLFFVYRISDCYLNLEEPEQVEASLEEGAELLAELGIEWDESYALNLAKYYTLRGDYDQAITHAEQLVNRTTNIVGLQEGYGILHLAYKAKGLYKEALEHYEDAMRYEDSLVNDDNVRLLTQSEMTYQFDQEREALEREQQLEASLLRAQTSRTRLIAVGILVVALLIGGFLVRSRQQNRLISRKNQQLAALNHTKDQLFSILGHDLRKPALSFQGIGRKVNYLLGKHEYDTIERLGNQIEQNANGLVRLIDNLLNWALLQKDRIVLTEQAVRLRPLAGDVAETFETVALDKGITLQNAVSEDLQVHTDLNALATILRNLIDNALKYTPPGGHVTIKGARQGDEVLLQVEDSGVGMDEAAQQRLLKQEVVASQRGTADEKGSGLGLHIVRELATLLDGSLRVKSAVGQGSEFSVVLPVRGGSF